MALYHEAGHILMKDIAKRQEISERYLEQLVLHLKAAGLVKPLRGANWIYSLAKSPLQIGLGEIIRVLEGSIAPVECVDDLNMCNRAPHCASRDIGKEVKETMENILESITMQDLVERQKSKQQCQKTM